MFAIAICDNEEEELNRSGQLIEQCLKNLQQSEEQEYRLELYTNGKKLLEDIKQGILYDAYFLDVVMPEIDGITLGKALREQNVQTPIIYTTFSKEFAIDAFDNEALDYLVKPLNPERLEHTLGRVWRNWELYHHRPYRINSKEGIIVVNLNDIMYVENVSRTAVFVLKDGRQIPSTSIRTTFERSLGSLPQEEEFIQPHKSFFINMAHVRLLRGDHLQMDNGREIPISRERASVVRKTYLKYLADKEG